MNQLVSSERKKKEQAEQGRKLIHSTDDPLASLLRIKQKIQDNNSAFKPKDKVVLVSK